ncbi:DNA polymerase III subunit gamma/tau [Caldalkalibacillus mannanilyticus]|uniref:DNA polymerase III subunit gamma/tau n=1 Tax=Caldalkalibacillus mannanilyticus TaxID=1418 RepID=UPI000469FD2B|nr:DNA polymerase III subunit gamma/tau [Caldalkalibacillus mannanilyticus]
MAYQALYRVYRPQAFADVVGQEHITKTLQNAIMEQNFSHAYLFNGPRGTGKTTIAKIMAKAVNCEEAPVLDPCNRCASCTGITQGRIVDVVEIDAASNNGVDEIRDIRDKVKFAPTEVRTKVYIIDEVHMLTQGAFNALLKTLEEPPAHVMFILATTEPHKIPLTIISRCQRFDFRRISKKAMLDRLQIICTEENIKVEEKALHMLIQVADGGMRDALSLLDQAISFAEEEVTLEDVLTVTGAVSQTALSELADAILSGKLEETIRFIDQLMNQGKEPVRLVEDLIYYFRDILLFQQAPNLDEVLERVQLTEEFKEKAVQYPKEKLFYSIQKLSEAQNEMKWTNHPRVFLEVACIQLVQGQGPPSEGQPQSVKATIDDQQVIQLQQKVNQLEALIQSLQEQGVKGSDEERKKNQATRHVPQQVSQQKILELLKSASKNHLMQLTNQWAEILQDIKKQKITVHAWLKDGEPVACSNDFFLIAFNNVIHRETTEKEAHRQIIEQVIAQHLQSSAKMITIMYNEWSEIKNQFIREQKGERNDSNGKSDPFYEEAVKLVGEELIEVIEK